MSKFSETINVKYFINAFSKIDIVVGGDHGQGKFRSVGKFVIINREGIDKDSYMIKNGHINCTKDIYEIFQKILACPINNDLDYLMREDNCLYFKCKEDG